MKISRVSKVGQACIVLFGMWFAGAMSLGQMPVITHLNNGVLEWSNPGGGLHMYSVEWAPTITSSSWVSHWENQAAIVTKESVISTTVPQFYRVMRGFDERCVEGPWMIYYDEGPNIMISNGRGHITTFGAFSSSYPAGYYSIRTNGAMDLVMYDRDNQIQITADRINAENMQFSLDGSTGYIHKITNPGAMAGTWRGTIGPYTNVVLTVRHDGFMPVVSNLITYSSGLAYAHSNNVSMSIFTGAAPENEWNRVQVRGWIINTTNILGDYTLDWEFGWLTASVHLQRK